VLTAHRRPPRQRRQNGIRLLSDEAVWQPAASPAARSDKSDRPPAIITVGRASKRKYEMKKLAAALVYR
jgi:hypothetical protein